MTKEQWLRGQIRSLEQHIRDDVDQVRIAFFQEVLERQRKALEQWLSPGPEEYSPEMVRSDCRRDCRTAPAARAAATQS